MKCPNCKKNIDYMAKLFSGEKMSECPFCGTRIKLKSENNFIKVFFIFFVFLALIGFLIDDLTIQIILTFVAVFISLRYLFTLESTD